MDVKDTPTGQLMFDAGAIAAQLDGMHFETRKDLDLAVRLAEELHRILIELHSRTSVA